MNGPAKYHQRPMDVEAYQWDGTVEGAAAVTEWAAAHDGRVTHEPATEVIEYGAHTLAPQGLLVETPAGMMRAYPGDYVVRGPGGEHYPFPEGPFTRTYEPAEAHQ